MRRAFFLYFLKSYTKKLGIVALILLIFPLIYHLERSFLPHFTSSFVKVEKLPNFVQENHSIIVGSFFEGDFCDVYLSGPSRRITYLGGWSCDDLLIKEFKIRDLVAEFDNKVGNYTLFVISDINETYELEFMVLP